MKVIIKKHTIQYAVHEIISKRVIIGVVVVLPYLHTVYLVLYFGSAFLIHFVMTQHTPDMNPYMGIQHLCNHSAKELESQIFCGSILILMSYGCVSLEVGYQMLLSFWFTLTSSPDVASSAVSI
jgi:hypothetical protein